MTNKVEEAKRILEEEKAERRDACLNEINSTLQRHRCQLVALQGEVRRMDGGAVVVASPTVGLVARD